jgi:transposase
MIMNQPAFLGMDVSKGYADFILLDPDKQILEEAFVLDDTRQGRQGLASLIDTWFSRGITHLYCGVESTGGYENNWHGFLCGLAGGAPRQGIRLQVARINPKAVKSCGEAGMLRTQTDQTSAMSIASYLINWPTKVRYTPTADTPADSTWSETRQHVRFMNMVNKQKTQLTNTLEKLIYQHLSELMIYCRHGIPGWMLRLLVRYPGRKRLLRAGPAKVAAIRGISRGKAQSLLDKLDGQLGGCSAGMSHTIAMYARQAVHLQMLLEKEETRLIARFENDPQVQLLNSIRGVGLASAVRLIAEIEDISRFNSVKKLCAYFGVHPTWKQSGDGIWYQGMSKKGRSSVRGTLFMCSLSAIRWNPDLHDLYHRFRKKKGMNHYQAMGVVMHKLLRIVYGVLKNQTPYDPDVDRQNRRTAIQKREAYEQKKAQKKQLNNTRRQRFNTSNENEQPEQAPISRRAWKKRKQEASQSSTKEECAGSPPAD